MDNPIADKVTVCLQSFQTLCSALLQPNLDFSEQILLPKVKDEFSRFKVWSGNIRAHRSGRSSLNYRLRDASHLRKQIISLLEDLNQSLGDAASIVLGETTPWDETSMSGDTFDRDNSEKPASDDLIEDSILATTELNQILSDIVEVVNCLLRLSVAIRNPAPHDRLMKSKSSDTSHYEPYDIQHVSMKFPGADKEITARLGKAISRRRQYFKYREEHHKLSQGLDFNSGMTEIVGPSTIVSPLPQHIKGGAGVAGDLGTLDEDERSETGISQTTYATSVANSEQIRTPPLPKQSKDGPFECPFCFVIISASTPLSWKKHVFKDLRPYICLWKDCLTADQEFSRRHEWMEHVMQKHWRTWHCAYGCQDTFPSASEFKQHTSRFHSDAVATTQLNALAGLSERRMALDVVMECPLCLEKVKSVKQYHRHVGRHQEELALFALPKITGPDKVEAEQHDSQGQPIESVGSGNPGQQSDGDQSGLSSASAAAEYPQRDEQDDDNPVETDGNSGHGASDRPRTDYDNSVTKEQWLEGFGNENDTVEAAASGYAPSVLSVPPYDPFTEMPAPSNQLVPFSSTGPYGYSQNPFSPPLGPAGNPFLRSSAATNAASSYYPYGTPQYGVPPMYYFQPPPAHTPNPPLPPPLPSPPPPPPPPDTREGEDARLKKIERILFGQRNEEDKKQEDARFAKLEQVLLDQQEARVRIEEERKRAVEEVAARAAETRKKGDEDKLAKLAKLEKLILAQKVDPFKRKAAAEAARATEKAEAISKAAKLLQAARKAREKAEAKAVKEAEETKAVHEKALVEAKAAAKELEKAEKAAEEDAKKAKKLIEEEAARNIPKLDEVKAPIMFKDAVGRKFSFPWHLCKTWKGMEELIKQAFLHVDIIGPHVHDGHYDLVGPNGEIILPQVWEAMVQPDWAITMHMWPMPESPPLPPPTPPEPPNVVLSPTPTSPFSRRTAGGSSRRRSLKRTKNT